MRGTLTPTRAPRLRTQRPALMITPLTGDAQIARGEALELESGAPSERDRAFVAGLDVGLQAVQPQRLEGFVQDELESLGHVALARVAGGPGVTEKGAFERSADDLRHVQPA